MMMHAVTKPAGVVDLPWKRNEQCSGHDVLVWRASVTALTTATWSWQVVHNTQMLCWAQPDDCV